MTNFIILVTMKSSVIARSPLIFQAPTRYRFDYAGLTLVTASLVGLVEPSYAAFDQFYVFQCIASQLVPSASCVPLFRRDPQHHKVLISPVESSAEKLQKQPWLSLCFGVWLFSVKKSSVFGLQFWVCSLCTSRKYPRLLLSSRSALRQCVLLRCFAKCIVWFAPGVNTTDG